jgi:hypothetical protein
VSKPFLNSGRHRGWRWDQHPVLERIDGRWMLGQHIQDLSPLIHSIVPKRITNKRTVSEALSDLMWLRDIHGVATLDVITEFLRLWDLISEVALHPEVSDVHFWRLSASRQCTAKSANEALFQGVIQFGPWECIWKTWASGKCRFYLWLTAYNRCWTVYCLARRNLPHLESCPSLRSR